MTERQEQIASRILGDYISERRFYMLAFYGAPLCVDEDGYLCLPDQSGDMSLLLFTDFNRVKVIMDDIKDKKEDLEIDPYICDPKAEECTVTKTSIVDTEDFAHKFGSAFNGIALDFSLFCDAVPSAQMDERIIDEEYIIDEEDLW